MRIRATDPQTLAYLTLCRASDHGDEWFSQLNGELLAKRESLVDQVREYKHLIRRLEQTIRIKKGRVTSHSFEAGRKSSELLSANRKLGRKLHEVAEKTDELKGLEDSVLLKRRELQGLSTELEALTDRKKALVLAERSVPPVQHPFPHVVQHCSELEAQNKALQSRVSALERARRKLADEGPKASACVKQGVRPVLRVKGYPPLDGCHLGPKATDGPSLFPASHGLKAGKSSSEWQTQPLWASSSARDRPEEADEHLYRIFYDDLKYYANRGIQFDVVAPP